MRLPWGEVQMIRRRVRGKPRRPWIELKSCGAGAAVKTGIFEQHVGRAEQLAGADTAAGAAFAPHLEQIGEIVAEQQSEIETGGVLTVILHTDALVGRAAPEKDRSHNVQHI